MHDIPSNLKFSKTHVWLEDLGENSYRVGITDFAQDELGDIVFVEPPEEGREYDQADECAVVESVKSTSDIYCPLSGIITEINSSLEDTPELLNSNPYDAGWIVKIKIKENSFMKTLLTKEEYSALIS